MSRKEQSSFLEIQKENSSPEIDIFKRSESPAIRYGAKKFY